MFPGLILSFEIKSDFPIKKRYSQVNLIWNHQHSIGNIDLGKLRKLYIGLIRQNPGIYPSYHFLSKIAN